MTNLTNKLFNMQDGEQFCYVSGTTNQIHNFANSETLREAYKLYEKGKVSLVQKVVSTFYELSPSGLVDKHNKYEYIMIKK